MCTSVGAAIGFLLGGGVGDFLAMKYPNIARPAVNQVSLVLAAPLYVCFLKALPGEIPRYMCILCAHEVLARVAWRAESSMFHRILARWVTPPLL